MFEYTKTDLKNKTVSELKTLAKRRKIELEEDARKEDIMAAILEDQESDKTPAPISAPPMPTPKTVPIPVVKHDHSAPKSITVPAPKPVSAPAKPVVSPIRVPSPEAEAPEVAKKEKKGLYHWVR